MSAISSPFALPCISNFAGNGTQVMSRRNQDVLPRDDGWAVQGLGPRPQGNPRPQAGVGLRMSADREEIALSFGNVETHQSRA